MPKPKPYTRLALTEAEFTDVRQCLAAQRLVGWQAMHDPTVAADERAFYTATVARLDALLARCDAVLQADTSQDAAPEEDDEEA